jgi:hypothetical protein
VTYDSGPAIINRYLSEEEKTKFLKAGYRIRIVKYVSSSSSPRLNSLMFVSTWRSLVPDLEDCPLALCDSRTINPDDFMPADRIIPDRVGEVYYLTHNKNHRWYVARIAHTCDVLTLFEGTGCPSRAQTSLFCSLCTIHSLETMHVVSEANQASLWCLLFPQLTPIKSVLTYRFQILQHLQMRRSARVSRPAL